MSTASAIDEAFTEIGKQYYPGSTRAIVRHPNRTLNTEPAPSAGDWDHKPRKYVVAGSETEFFTVGQLAQALGRQPVTIRKWEREGVIPRSTFQSPGRDGDVRGRRRLYTRAQVEGMVRIAAEEGVLVSHQKPIKGTQFTPRVIDLFKALAEQ
ncbi:MerR family transcriptional regulator [Streptomyces sp. MI02-2A]|uniref:MerR family transcriptional regulator n=1 Tax=Streptomyces sp. MI02-2A TaxID=3028688 RepID=UPI0029BD313C|nr:MerR family transcriptional regulator [Streptomyces sp. MI02-2A]MDX3260724.1 MerR family transcriptional regulator [Streptomyces sp. MI02-2A]